MADRLGEITSNLSEFRSRVDAACAAAGRDPSTVSLIAVTKTFPASDVRLLAQVGITDVGENRDQEAAPKAEQCSDLSLRWHFIGALQRNKCRSVASYADVVHSVDRDRLVPALSRAAEEAARGLVALVQVSLDSPDAGDGRAGVAPESALALADAVASSPGLTLGGVMAVAPLGVDPSAAFDRLAQVGAMIRRSHPDATTVSAGMSGDFEAAIRHGATHLRVGTALLGRRSALVG
jgi:hypothetical protein